MAAWTDKEIGQHAEEAESKRSAIMPLVDQCMIYGMPWRSRLQRGRPVMDQLFDSTGPSAVQTFVKRNSTALTPPFQRWFELEAGPVTDPDQVEASNRTLMDCTSVLHASLDASNFQIKSEEFYADLSIGTGALLGLEGDDDNPVVWHSVPPWQLGLEEGSCGTIENVYWCKRYPVERLMRNWPKAAWPQAIRDKIAANQRDHVEILQASYYDSADKAFRMAVMVRDNGAPWHTVYETLNRANPWVVSRWWTTPGDPWGRGPLMLALPDIKTANKTVEMILKAAAYSLAPPLMVLHDGVVNPDTLRLSPNALIKVARTGGPMGRSIEPMDIGARTDLSQLVLQEIRDTINKRLLARQLPPQTGAVRSPTEIMERLKDYAFETNSSFGRLNHEFVPGVIARLIDILDRKKVPLIRWDKLRIDQLNMKVKVTSPLARSQKLEDVQNAIRFAELVKSLGGDELLALVVPIEDAFVRMASELGVPNWMVRPKADRDQLQQHAGQALADAAAGPESVPTGQVQTGQPLRLVS